MGKVNILLLEVNLLPLLHVLSFPPIRKKDVTGPEKPEGRDGRERRWGGQDTSQCNS